MGDNVLKIYDASLDAHRTATQDDIDALVSAVAAYARLREGIIAAMNVTHHRFRNRVNSEGLRSIVYEKQIYLKDMSEWEKAETGFYQSQEVMQ